jgi:hypothetical protein
MQTLTVLSRLVAATLSLAAFARYACFLSGLYPVFPELFCYSGYGRVFEALLAASLGVHLASVSSLALAEARTSLPSLLLMLGAVIVSAALLFNAFAIVHQLNRVQFDAGCERGAGPLLLRLFTLAYVGPVVSSFLGLITVALGYRALRRRAF